MPHPVKASLVAEDEDQQTRSELEAYQEREHARRERAAVIRMVKEDMQSRRRMPDVSEPTTYELGEDGEIPVIVEPKDEDGIVKVSLDTTGDGEIDAVLCFDKKKKLRDIKDLHSKEVEEEEREREREEREHKEKSKEESDGLTDMLEGKTTGQSDGLVGGMFGDGADDDGEGKSKRKGDDDDEEEDKEDDDAKADADTYAKLQPMSYLMGGDKKPKKHNPAAKKVDVTYAKRRRRGRKRNRYHGAMMR